MIPWPSELKRQIGILGDILFAYEV